jgi:hypothetical protein
MTNCKEEFKIKELNELIAMQNVVIPTLNFVIDLILAGLLSYILSIVYKKYGRSISNRAMFSSNFLLLCVMTMIVITIFKSSLALSLGLVGALSIVRFRTVIKEPEELNYLFLCIAIGLGLCAGQREISCISFLFVVLFILLGESLHKGRDDYNLQLIISADDPQGDEPVTLRSTLVSTYVRKSRSHQLVLP